MAGPPIISLDDYGLLSPPALVFVREAEALASDCGRAGAEAPDSLAWLRQTGSRLHKLVKDIERGGADNLDAVISDLERIEQEVAKGARWHSRAAAESLGSRKRAARLDRPDLVAAANAIIEKANEASRVMQVAAAAFRDARWQLMTLRGDNEDPGDSPVFDDVDDMMGHILG